jgi:tRNA A-37 threonylcarbamoyl transferase component Bud32
VLTPGELTAHLVSRGFLPAEAVVRGGLTITDTSRRNGNVTITTGRSGLFVKQQRDRTDTIAREAAVYRLLRNRSEIARYLPSLRGHDRRRRLLILELVRNGRSIAELLQSRRRIGRSVARELGRAVAAAHHTTAPIDWPTPPAWILGISCPPIEILQEWSAANLEILRIIQESRGLCRSLEELRERWSPAALIHGDLRLENFVVSGRGLKLVDWEHSGRGDPGWDAGCVFASFLAHWVLSMRDVSGNPERSARLPLAGLRRAIVAFWNAYAEARDGELLVQSTRFAAARLLQLAIERTARASALTGNVIVMLQLSVNMMRRPEEAAQTLLGIGEP